MTSTAIPPGKRPHPRGYADCRCFTLEDHRQALDDEKRLQDPPAIPWQAMGRSLVASLLTGVLCGGVLAQHADALVLHVYGTIWRLLPDEE